MLYLRKEAYKMLKGSYKEQSFDIGVDFIDLGRARLAVSTVRETWYLAPAVLGHSN